MTDKQQKQYKEIMSTCRRIGSNSSVLTLSQLDIVLKSIMPFARELDQKVDQKEYFALVSLYSSLSDLIKIRSQFESKLKTAQDALARKAQA